MARFYAAIQGARGEATRLGGEGSGIRGHVRGWDAGVRVLGFVDDEGRDAFHVYATGGSNGGARDELLGVVRDTPEGPTFQGAS